MIIMITNHMTVQMRKMYFLHLSFIVGISYPKYQWVPFIQFSIFNAEVSETEIVQNYLDALNLYSRHTWLGRKQLKRENGFL